MDMVSMSQLRQPGGKLGDWNGEARAGRLKAELEQDTIRDTARLSPATAYIHLGTGYLVGSPIW
jgi:hypothetical protein